MTAVALDVEHHTMTVGDVRLHYVIAGSGPVVVLLHGWPQTWASWRDVIPPLAERYTVIAPDMRGLGLSSRPDSGYDMATVAGDIHGLVAALGYDEVLLAGHDWGAAAAYAYAADHPEAVKRLAIFEMVLPGFDMMEGAMVPQPGGQFLWHMGWQSVPDVPQALLQGREDVFLRWFFQFYAYDPSAVGPEQTAEYVRAMTQIGALRAGLEYYKAYFDTAAQNRVHRERKLEMPVMAWAGEACLGPLTLQCMELAAHDVRGGVIERCGHWIGEERPDFVAEQLLDFFGEDASRDRFHARHGAADA